MRVWAGRFFPIWMLPHNFRSATAGDFQVTEDAMMPRAVRRIDENSEEQKYIADAHSLAMKVALGSTYLTKPAEIIRKHRIVVAKRVSAYPAACSLLNQIPEAKVSISRRRSPSGRDR
jgi:hypothetical protein